MVVASSDTRPASVDSDLYRCVCVSGWAYAQLTEVIVSPTPESIVRLQTAGMVVASSDTRPASVGADLYRYVPVSG